MDAPDSKSDEEYSVIGDKGDIGFVDFDMCQSVLRHNPSEESNIVEISVPFQLIDKKPQSGLVGERKHDMVIIKNISNEPLDICSVRIYDAKPENSFRISLMEPPNSDSDIQDFVESDSLEDRVLKPNRSLAIWLSCKPKEMGLHTASLLFSVGNDTIERLVFVLAEDAVSKSLFSKKPYQRSTRNKQELLNVKSPDAAYFGGQRPARPSNGGTRYRLPSYPIPENIRTMVNNQQIPDAVNEGLTRQNYASFFMALLAMEEIKLEEAMHAYDMDSVQLKRINNEFLSLEVPGLAEKRPSLLIGDYIFAKSAGEDEPAKLRYQGFIHRVEAEKICLKFDMKFHAQHRETHLYKVSFTYNRTGMRKLYQALEAAEKLSRKFLFPSIRHDIKPQGLRNVIPISSTLNEEQTTAVQMILSSKGGLPYVIYGPPGTGKSMTVVEAIIQLYNMNRKNVILVCAPSNSAADHLLERIISVTSVEIQKNEIFRLNAFTRPLEDINPKLMDFCCIEDEAFRCPEHSILKKYRIVVSTYASASNLYAQELRRGHFSHIFLDEAGQASEPETMVPLSHFYVNKTVVVLAGDPMQLGPIIFSRQAETCGLGTSYLQRLLDVQLYSDGDKNFMTKLVRNYRSHEAILCLSSEMFYDSTLIPCREKGPPSTSSWDSILPNKGFPLLFIGIQGCDEREGNNPSWFNRVEASKVVDMVRLLTQEKAVKQEDIGVITPYRQQVCKITCALEKLRMDGVKIGSVEQFQGQEKEIIVISTVRSTIKHNESDRVHCLGFLSNSKRFNVAVTRAKSLLVVIGNPHILCKDQNWNRLLWYCADNGSYQGCFLPEKEDYYYSATRNHSTSWKDGWNSSQVPWGADDDDDSRGGPDKVDDNSNPGGSWKDCVDDSGWNDLPTPPPPLLLDSRSSRRKDSPQQRHSDSWGGPDKVGDGNDHGDDSGWNDLPTQPPLPDSRSIFPNDKADDSGWNLPTPPALLPESWSRCRKDSPRQQQQQQHCDHSDRKRLVSSSKKIGGRGKTMLQAKPRSKKKEGLLP